ncbi:MAG: AAA family ATPase [Planctomycetota bacterium]
MLKKLRLHNFRTYLNAEFSFTQRHLVIGHNNSGKTNLYAAMRFLGASASLDFSKCVFMVPGGLMEIKNWAFNSNVVELSCECELLYEGEPHQFAYCLNLIIEQASGRGGTGDLQPALRVTREELTVNSKQFGNVVLLTSDGREANMLHEEQLVRRKQENRVTTLSPRDSTMLFKLYELETNRRAILFRRYLTSWTFFTLNPDQLRFGWKDASAEWSSLSPSGHNLAIAIFHVKNFNERRYRNILDHVRLIEPDLQAINFITAAGQPPFPIIELQRRPQASWAGLSDGTLRTLAFAWIAEAVRIDQTSPSDRFSPLIVIEEPENGIFPGQLRPILDWFEEHGSGGQFVFTSHSPYFINLFDAQRESVTLLRRSNERTEVVPVPIADESDPDRLLLAEQYSMELLG